MPASENRGLLIREPVSIARVVGRNTLASAIARVAVLAAWFLATPRVLASLGEGRFGFWSILLLLGGSLNALDLGLGVAATRFVARLHAEGRDRAVRGLLARIAGMQLLASSALALAVYAARDIILEAFHVPLAWQGDARRALEISVVGFVVASLANLLFASIQGLQRTDRALLVSLPATVGLGLGLLWATGAPRPLVALIEVQLGYAAFTAAGYALLLLHLVSGKDAAPSPGGAPPQRLRDLFSFGGWVQFNAIFGLVQTHVDKVLLGTLVALAPVATYELGARMTLAASFPPMLFLGALLPAFSRAAGAAGEAPPIALYEAALAPHFALCIGLCGGLIALAPWLVTGWLGVPPAQTAVVLALLTVTLLGNLLTGISGTAVRAGGGIRIESVWAVLGTALHVALALAGLRLYGVIGLLVGTALASLLGAAWFIVRVESWLGLSPPLVAWRALHPFLLVGGLAGAAAFLVAGALAPLGPPGRGAAFLALAAGGATYVAVFLGSLRALHPALWRSMRARANRLTGAIP